MFSNQLEDKIMNPPQWATRFDKKLTDLSFHYTCGPLRMAELNGVAYWKRLSAKYSSVLPLPALGADGTPAPGEPRFQLLTQEYRKPLSDDQLLYKVIPHPLQRHPRVLPPPPPLFPVKRGGPSIVSRLKLVGTPPGTEKRRASKKLNLLATSALIDESDRLSEASTVFNEKSAKDKKPASNSTTSQPHEGERESTTRVSSDSKAAKETCSSCGESPGRVNKAELKRRVAELRKAIASERSLMKNFTANLQHTKAEVRAMSTLLEESRR
jgi:hypothetical protein